MRLFFSGLRKLVRRPASWVTGGLLALVYGLNRGADHGWTSATTLLLGGQIPVTIPETGPLGTALIVVPIVPPLTSILESGYLTVQLIRGTLSGSSCDDVFVDTVNLAIAIRP